MDPINNRIIHTPFQLLEKVSGYIAIFDKEILEEGL